MIPKSAVVCAAHTQIGKYVVRNLLRSPHIHHIYALCEVDIRDSITLPQHEHPRLTLLIQPLEYLERTISSSIPHADLAFYCLCTPRHLVPSLGAYLFHKLNFDLPLRFLQEMIRLSAHSVALLSHPAASPKARSHFLRVKGQLDAAARHVVQTALPNAPRLTLLAIPAVALDPRRPLDHHETDHIFNGERMQPLRPLDRIRQKAVLKHDPDAPRLLRVSDIAVAMVADAVDSVDIHSRDDVDQLRHEAQHIVMLDAKRIVQLANTARALRSRRVSEQRDRHAMRDKVSTFAKQQGNYSSSENERLHEGAENEEGSSFEEEKEGYTPWSPVAAPSLRTGGRRRRSMGGGSGRGSMDGGFEGVPADSVHALAEQRGRRLTVVHNNDVLPDAVRRTRRYTEEQAARRHASRRRGYVDGGSPGGRGRGGGSGGVFAQSKRYRNGGEMNRQQRSDSPVMAASASPLSNSAASRKGFGSPPSPRSGGYSASGSGRRRLSEARSPSTRRSGAGGRWSDGRPTHSRSFHGSGGMGSGYGGGGRRYGDGYDGAYMTGEEGSVEDMMVVGDGESRRRSSSRLYGVGSGRGRKGGGIAAQLSAFAGRVREAAEEVSRVRMQRAERRRGGAGGRGAMGGSGWRSSNAAWA